MADRPSAGCDRRIQWCLFYSEPGKRGLWARSGVFEQV